MFSLLPLMVLYFPCCVRVSLDYKLEFFSSNNKKNILMSFQSIMSQKTKCNLFLSTNVLFFGVLTILMHFSIILQYPQSKRKISSVKRKSNTWSSCMIFFRIFCWTKIYFKRLIIYESSIAMKIINT